MTEQLITPNPHIPCTPGWCLQYVRQAFDLPIRYASATEAWNNSASQHRDWSFPAGCWVPIWFAIDIEPNGHVALLAPDGSVYSSSDLTSTPHHHPNIGDLVSYYARWGNMQLTYLGWTEDVAGYPVVSNSGSINVDSITPTPQEENMDLTDAQYERIGKVAAAYVMTDLHGGNTLGEFVTENRSQYTNILDGVGKIVAALNFGIVISRVQAEDIVSATTARVIDDVRRQTASLAQAVTAASAPGAALDVTALAQQLAPLLNANQAEQFMTALRTQLNKP